MEYLTSYQHVPFGTYSLQGILFNIYLPTCTIRFKVLSMVYLKTSIIFKAWFTYMYCKASINFKVLFMEGSERKILAFNCHS